MSKKIIAKSGGQLQPERPGHFHPEKGGQFHPEKAGVLIRNIQFITSNCVFRVFIENKKSECKYLTIAIFTCFSSCDPDGILTHDLQNRNLTLYTAELRSHFGAAKVRKFIISQKKTY